MTIDMLVVLALVTGAAIYLFRKFTKTSKHENEAGCSSGGCCGRHDHTARSSDCNSKT